MAQIRSKPFGVTKEGANVTEYILSNPGGMSVSVLDYGCVIKNIIVPAKNLVRQHLLRCVCGALC